MPGPQRNDGGPPKAARPNDLLRYSHLGLQFVLVFLLFAFLGFKADEKLGTLPLLTVLGVMVGFGLSFYQLYLAVFGERRGVPPKAGHTKGVPPKADDTKGSRGDKGPRSSGEASTDERDPRG